MGKGSDCGRGGAGKRGNKRGEAGTREDCKRVRDSGCKREGCVGVIFGVRERNEANLDWKRHKEERDRRGIRIGTSGLD